MKRVLVAIVLLLLVPPAAWLVAEQRLSAGLDAWVADRTAEGWVIRRGSAVRSGFPMQAGLVLTDVSLSRSRGPVTGGLDWTVPSLELRLDPLSPRTLLLRPDGAQHFRLGLLPALELDAQDARVRLPLDLAAEAPITATAAALRVEGSGTSLATGRLSLDLTLHSGARQGEAAGRLAATDVSISGLPGSLASLAVTGALEGPIGGPTQDSTPAALAAAWRDRGGKIVLQSIAIRWGRMAASGSATLSLDAALQPHATGTVRLSGYDEGLDRLAAAGVIGPGAARAAKAVLGLMTQPNDDGLASVELPLGWQDGVLSAGRIPLLRTPPLDWAPALAPD